MQFHLFMEIIDNIADLQLNFFNTFLIPSNTFYATEGIKKALKEFGCTSAMLSRIQMHKEHCITKEKYEEMYKTDEESEKRMDLSLGEDLETLIEGIKNGKIYTDTKNGEIKKLFLLCLLLHF